MTRVVDAKPGLDEHDRGAKIIARALRDAGVEMVYTGLHQKPEQIVETVTHDRHRCVPSLEVHDRPDPNAVARSGDRGRRADRLVQVRSLQASRLAPSTTSAAAGDGSN